MIVQNIKQISFKRSCAFLQTQPPPVIDRNSQKNLCALAPTMRLKILQSSRILY